MTLIVHPNSTLRRLVTGEWVLSHFHLRKHLEVDAKLIQALTQMPKGGSEADWLEKLKGAKAWPRTQMPNPRGLLENPTGLGSRTGEIVEENELFKSLRSNLFLVEEGSNEYETFIAVKNDLLDRKHLGSFHQILGQYLLLNLRRKDTWKWWHDQKFTEDGRNLRPGLYREVQFSFLNDYFPTKSLQGKQLLDFGCGNGFYSHFFHQRGAQVLGLDTSPELIQLARTNYPDVKFYLSQNDSDSIRMIESLPAKSFDAIYWSDVLLFFFYHPQTSQPQTEYLQQLLTALSGRLKDDGRLYFMEPNSYTYLAPFFGHRDTPELLISEYRQRTFNVAPGTDQILEQLHQAGFTLERLIHPPISKTPEGMDPDLVHLAKNFPIWDFYVAKKS